MTGKLTDIYYIFLPTVWLIRKHTISYPARDHMTNHPHVAKPCFSMVSSTTTTPPDTRHEAGYAFPFA